ncbi:hypothetical protein DFQ29_006802 [Apophysomyces sp. BC1021]|nr:hypothetical protein DFQ29_006802 [Apophysomyces sp. BC1021]
MHMSSLVALWTGLTTFRTGQIIQMTCRHIAPALDVPDFSFPSTLTSKICAIRETFEESGLLLTDPPASTIPNFDTVAWRKKVHDDASQFKVMCDAFHLRPAVEHLVPFANWITPVHEKKRYNTQFFLTVLKDKILPTDADGEETVQLDWFTPEQGIAVRHQKNQYPDYRDLAAKAGVGSLRTHDGHVVPTLPQIGKTESDDPMAKDGYHAFLAYPGDAEYVAPNISRKPGQKHRLYFRKQMQDLVVVKNLDVTDVVQAKL